MPPKTAPSKTNGTDNELVGYWLLFILHELANLVYVYRCRLYLLPLMAKMQATIVQQPVSGR